MFLQVQLWFYPEKAYAQTLRLGRQQAIPLLSIKSNIDNVGWLHILQTQPHMPMQYWTYWQHIIHRVGSGQASGMANPNGISFKAAAAGTNTPCWYSPRNHALQLRAVYFIKCQRSPCKGSLHKRKGPAAKKRRWTALNIIISQVKLQPCIYKLRFHRIIS